MAENAAPQEKPDSIPFYPDHVRTELWVTLGIVAVVFVIGALGMLFPLGLGAPADPLDTPEHIKPEWYFLALYQLLKFVPKTAGVLLPIIGLVVLMLWPFIDRRPDASPRAARIRLIVVGVAVVGFIAMTIWGELS